MPVHCNNNDNNNNNNDNNTSLSEIGRDIG